MDNSVLIIIPTYNEKENIEIITQKVMHVYNKANILIIDDNSPDGTGDIADELSKENSQIKVIHRQGKAGLGRAYVQGFKYALDNGYDYVFEMDADLSHDPKYIPDFLSSMKNADLVIGSRYITGVNVINWPMSRLLLSYFANIVARIITGLPLRDSTGGYKCISRKVLEKIDLDKIGSEGYSFQIEINFKAWKMGYKIKEIPIVFYDRQHGESKMSTGIIREALMLLWKMRVVNLFKPIKRVV